MKQFRLSKIARQYTEYDLITKYITLPVFAESRLRLLHTFLSRSSNNVSFSELACISTALIQIGLDVHDDVLIQVDNENLISMRKRQMQVLGGDYFSSLFYKMLADAEHIDLIHTISVAVCDANLLKSRLYTQIQQNYLKEQDYFAIHVQLKEQLFLSFTKLIGEDYEKQWLALLHEYSCCEVVFEELNKMNSGQLSKDSWVYWYIYDVATNEEKQELVEETLDGLYWKMMLNKYKADAHLIGKLFQTNSVIQNTLFSLNSDKIIREIMQISEPFIRFVCNIKPILANG